MFFSLGVLDCDLLNKKQLTQTIRNVTGLPRYSTTNVSVKAADI